MDDVAQEMLWLAFQAANPMGRGFLHTSRAAQATKEDVVEHCKWQGRYVSDYVYGRMMKLNLSTTENDVILPSGTPRSDYQSWCHNYSTYEDLMFAAVESLENQE